MTVDRIFVDASVRRLRQMTERIGDCAGRLNDDQVWMRGSETENAVGNLILHLCGNLRQWIIAGIGGASFTRDRDAEFTARGGVTPAQLIAKLAQTVEEACAVIEAVPGARLTERVSLQSYDLSVLEAIYHVVDHFALHYGQIAFATKLLTHQDLGFYAHLTKPDHGRQTP